MWRSLCCSVRETTSTSNLNTEEQETSTEAPVISVSMTSEHKEEKSPLDEKEKPREEPLSQSDSTTDKQELGPDNQPSLEPVSPEQQESQSQDNYRVRSHSASEIKRPTPGKSLAWGLEGIAEGKMSRSTLQVIPNPSIVACGSSESIYQTPPTSRHPSVSSHHPLGKTKKTGPPTSTLSQTSRHSPSRAPIAPSPPQDGKSGYLQELLVKMEEARQERQEQHQEMMKSIADFSEKLDKVLSKSQKMEETKQERQEQHQEMMKLISDFSEKLDKVLSDIQGSRRNERDVSTDGVLYKRTASNDISGAVLPQNTPVSSKVLLRLSKRVAAHQWKFLGRWLNIPDHELDTISANHKEDIQEQSYQMLLKWTQSNGGGSYQELGEAVKMEFGEQLYSDYVKMVIETERRPNFMVPNSQ